MTDRTVSAEWEAGYWRGVVEMTHALLQELSPERAAGTDKVEIAQLNRVIAGLESALERFKIAAPGGRP